MTAPLRATRHATSRQAQRNLSAEDIQFVLEHGQRIRCAGALHIFLRRRDLPSDKDSYRRFARLEGTVLVMDDTGGEPVLITVYRNRRALKQIRAKAKHYQTAATHQPARFAVSA